MKKIAIVQSNYIPWKGYFDMINMVDEFILYDEVQYTKNDWRNRNRIKTFQGIIWLTIPVRQLKLKQKINETKVINDKWRKKHWNTLSQSYAKSPYFKDYKDIFEALYLNDNEMYLSKINYQFITTICNILGINTKIRWSNEFTVKGDKTERLLEICNQCNANTYLSGPAAKNYFNEALAEERNINVEWMDYNGYEEYHQLHSPFENNVTILDLIFNEGKNAQKYMKSFKDNK